MGGSMEGVPVLVTDSKEGFSYNILDFLLAENALPFVFFRNFETVQEFRGNYPQCTPLVLNPLQNIEVTIDLLYGMPSLSCIFNFEGEMFENVVKSTFAGKFRTITAGRGEFRIEQVHRNILEAISEGCILIINLIPRPLYGAGLLTKKGSNATCSFTISDSTPTQERLLRLEKMFYRKPGKVRVQPLPPPVNPETVNNKINETVRHRGRSRKTPNLISLLLKKWFSRFNPCGANTVLPSGAHPVLEMRRTASSELKSFPEICEYIWKAQSKEIHESLETLHATALKNWSEICDTQFKFTSEHTEKLRLLSTEIEKKGEEGRKTLMKKLQEDIEITSHWDHILGPHALKRIEAERKKEVSLLVQKFCDRKMMEARQEIHEEINLYKNREKARFYEQILEQQVSELTRIKEKFQKKSELLMLPHTGQLHIINS